MADKERNEMLVNAGRRFKEIRKQNDFTQEQIAKFLQVDRSLIAKFEVGERSLGMALIEKACSLFGCEAAAVLEEQEYCPLAVDYLAKDLTLDDIEVVSKVQQIALNLRRIKVSLESE